MRRAAVLGVVLLVALGVWHTYREVQRDACFTGGRAISDYDGMTVPEAEAAAERDVVRVVGRDGTCFDATSDRRHDRVNVYVEDGEVAQARRY